MVLPVLLLLLFLQAARQLAHRLVADLQCTAAADHCDQC
jgi:hypothetical protein